MTCYRGQGTSHSIPQELFTVFRQRALEAPNHFVSERIERLPSSDRGPCLRAVRKDIDYEKVSAAAPDFVGHRTRIFGHVNVSGEQYGFALGSVHRLPLG
jgi:hypothetical protein